MKKARTKCYIYTRVSTAMQVDGYSLDAQREKLRKYADYEDMVIAVDEGEMRFQPEGSEDWEYAVVGMGFVEIVHNRVTLLVETAERPEEIDVARAQEAKERAEEQLRQKQSIQEYHMNQMALARAMTRLKVTHKQ